MQLPEPSPTRLATPKKLPVQGGHTRVEAGLSTAKIEVADYPSPPSAAICGMEQLMNTPFLLMAQYSGMVIIPLERICADYFSHLTPKKMKLKVAAGEIDLRLVGLESSQKSARGVHLNDLAAYLYAQHARALTERKTDGKS